VLSRISALTLEHREVKNHWLAEKSDLQARNFQMQALNTQYAGSLKKKEKDFEKLQNQLAKIVKDANKAQAKPAIVMSLPVRKNLSQGAAEPGSALTILKDAEVQAAKKTITTLDVRTVPCHPCVSIVCDRFRRA
jgi:flagellar biosynthesis component FlhA